MVPSDHAILEIQHDEAVVERLEDVLVELAQPIELVGLGPQLAVEAAVLERRGHLAGHRREQRHVFAAQRLRAVLAAERRARRSCLPSRRTARSSTSPQSRQNSISSSVNRRLAERIVERDGVSGLEAAADAGAPLQRRRRDREA